MAEPALTLRPATPADADALWGILEPIVRAGEVYAQPVDLDRAGGLAYWCGPDHVVFVAERDGQVLGSYYLRANQRGGGAHVANCGYMTAIAARGQGVAGLMCDHSLGEARRRGFEAMQFNFVVESNRSAVHLWGRHGFEVVGRVPDAFRHPRLGLVAALILWRRL